MGREVLYVRPRECKTGLQQYKLDKNCFVLYPETDLGGARGKRDGEIEKLSCFPHTGFQPKKGLNSKSNSGF